MNSDLVLGQRVIELGAGTGLVGLVAHALGKSTCTCIYMYIHYCPFMLTLLVLKLQ